MFVRGCEYLCIVNNDTFLESLIFIIFEGLGEEDLRGAASGVRTVSHHRCTATIVGSLWGHQWPRTCAGTINLFTFQERKFWNYNEIEDTFDFNMSAKVEIIYLFAFYKRNHFCVCACILGVATTLSILLKKKLCKICTPFLLTDSFER